MPSPFPGMDPYLEDSNIWPSCHHFLADEIAAQLNSHLDPRYYADVEVQTVAEDVMIAATRTIYPDAAVLERENVESPSQAGSGAATAVAIPAAPIQRIVPVTDRVKLRAVRIHTIETEQLVTSIEILPPFNKRPGEGVDAYRHERSLLLQSPVHVLEIDLLRGGVRPGPEIKEPSEEVEYVLLVNRATPGDFRLSEIWPVALNEPLPLLPVPLLNPDPDIILDLGAALRVVYARAGYDRRIDYKRPVPPPNLRPEMVAWLRQHLPEVAPAA